MPAHQTIELDEEPAIVVRKLGPPVILRSQYDQLISERYIPSSRLFGLNGEARTARTKQISAIIAPT
jgi:hypothetical protein